MDGFHKIIFTNKKMIFSGMYKYYIPELYHNSIHKHSYYLHMRDLEQIITYKYENDI